MKLNFGSILKIGSIAQLAYANDGADYEGKGSVDQNRPGPSGRRSDWYGPWIPD